MQKTIILSLVLAGVAWSQPLPRAGQIYQSKKFDLNGDGRAERVELTAYRIHHQSDSFWGQLRVTDNRGKLVWQAPQAKKSTDSFAFGSWPYGLSDLEFLGHLGGDAKVELLSPRSQSDARPPTYRRYRWAGNAFQAMPNKMLLESPAGSGAFTWTDPIEWDGQKPLTWVMKISGDSAKPRASIYASQEGGQALVGEANVAFDAKGLRVTSWVKKLSPTSRSEGATQVLVDDSNRVKASPSRAGILQP
jgi:hypothetical protein